MRNMLYLHGFFFMLAWFVCHNVPRYADSSTVSKVYCPIVMYSSVLFVFLDTVKNFVVLSFMICPICVLSARD